MSSISLSPSWSNINLLLLEASDSPIKRRDKCTEATFSTLVVLLVLIQSIPKDECPILECMEVPSMDTSHIILLLLVFVIINLIIFVESLTLLSE
jgi:hypothetical protein